MRDYTAHYALVIRLYAPNEEEAQRRVSDAVAMAEVAMMNGCSFVYFVIYHDERDPKSDYGGTADIFAKRVMSLNLERAHRVIYTPEDPFVGQLNRAAQLIHNEKKLDYMLVASPETKEMFKANIGNMWQAMKDHCPAKGGTGHVISVAVPDSAALVRRGRPNNQFCAWYLPTLLGDMPTTGFQMEDRRRKPFEPKEEVVVNEGTPNEARYPKGGVEEMAVVIAMSMHLKAGGFIIVLEPEAGSYTPYSDEEAIRINNKVATKSARQNAVCKRLGFNPCTTYLFVAPTNR